MLPDSVVSTLRTNETAALADTNPRSPASAELKLGS